MNKNSSIKKRKADRRYDKSLINELIRGDSEERAFIDETNFVTYTLLVTVFLLLAINAFFVEPQALGYVLSQQAIEMIDEKIKGDVTLICPGCKYWVSCETESMYPTFDCNDTLIGVEPQSRKDIRAGDIIWFPANKEVLTKYRGTEYVAHRVKKIDYRGCYATQGDNNDFPDEYATCFYDVKLVIRGIIYG